VIGDDSHDVFSQPSDDFQGFVVFSQSFNEHEGGITSVVSEFFSLSGDFGFSVVDPDQVLLGGGDFVLQPFSVFSGFVSDSFVLVGDGGQLSDLSTQSFFLSFVDFVSSGLRVDVGLFQVGQ
jgi:hypothetical protein